MPVSRPEEDFIQLQESRTVFAVFKGSNVAVKETRIKSVELNRDVLLELKQVCMSLLDSLNLETANLFWISFKQY